LWAIACPPGRFHLAELLKQQRSRFGLAALPELHLYLGEALIAEALERRQEIGDIAFNHGLHASTGHFGRWTGLAQRLLELVQRALLAAFPEWPQGLAVALSLGPDRGDRDDLLVQTSGAGTEDGKVEGRTSWAAVR
jgi:hypothetical protein